MLKDSPRQAHGLIEPDSAHEEGQGLRERHHINVHPQPHRDGQAEQQRARLFFPLVLAVPFVVVVDALDATAVALRI